MRLSVKKFPRVLWRRQYGAPWVRASWTEWDVAVSVFRVEEWASRESYISYRNRHLPLTLFISRLTFHLHLRLRAHFSTAYSFDLKMEASDSIETYVTLCYRRLRIRQWSVFCNVCLKKFITRHSFHSMKLIRAVSMALSSPSAGCQKPLLCSERFLAIIAYMMRRNFVVRELSCHYEMQLVLTKLGSVRTQLVLADQVPPHV